VISVLDHSEEFDGGFDGDGLVITIPLEIEADVVGTVQFAFDRAPLRAEIMQILLERAWQSSALIALGITLAYLISRKVTQPLKTLAASAEKIGDGNLEEPVQAQGAKETRVLGSALERMRLELRELYGRLEIKVAERTQEISDINLDLEREIEVRKLAETALRESEGRLQSLIESAAAGIITIDDKSIVESINSAAERMFGYRQDEMAGQPVSILMPAPYRDEHNSSIAKLSSSSGSNIIGTRRELQGLRRDGTVFPIEMAVSESWSGGRRTFIGIISDETDHKNAEDERTRHALALESANKELEAFSYSVSHDLRAPLRSINGFSQALLDDCADELGETGRDYLHRVMASSERMAELIDDLLQLSRITRSEMKREEVDLSRMVASIVSGIQDAQPERQVKFNIAPDLASHGDERLLRVMLENLLSNSWKFTGKQPQGEIIFGVEECGGIPAYFVRDNGAGFDMAYTGKLFAAFQRLHSTTEFDGTGVGLAIVQRVIQRHGGQVWAEGAVGEGATFYFTLQPQEEIESGGKTYSVSGRQSG
jgi:PAS domain S-box-containing protein